MVREKSLPLTMDCQDAVFWCWAAVAQSLNAFEGRVTSQEQVATHHVGKLCSASDAADASSVCGSPCTGSCNSPHRLSEVLRGEGHLVRATLILGLTFQEVVDVIDSGKPLPLRIDIKTGSRGGHFVCIIGYADDGSGNEFVVILDPLVPGLGRGKASVRDIPFDAMTFGYRVNGDDGIPNYKYELS